MSTQELPAPAPDAGSTPGDDALDRKTLAIAGVTVLGAIMAILDITVVNVALPTLSAEFEVSYAVVAWTATAYTLALASVIPVTGWAADRFGTKRLYIAAIVAFVIGSALAGLSWDIGSLIVFRVVQGIGGGMIMPLGMTILTRAAGPTRVGRVMALLGIPMLLGPISGPILGGWLIDDFSWHWIFFINVPIGIAAVIAAWRVLPGDEPQPGERFDFLGMALLSPGLALFLFGVSSIAVEDGDLGAPRVWLSALVGVVLIGAFVSHALRTDHPLIDLRLLRNRTLTVAVVTLSAFAIAFFGAMLLLPVYFLNIRFENTLHTGLLLAPQGIGAMLTMPIAGRLTDKMGPGKFVLGGLTLILAGMAFFTQIEADTSYLWVCGALFVMGLGMGMTMMPIMSAALATLTPKVVARASTMMNIIQQVAASIGTAIFSVLLTQNIKDSLTELQLPPGAPAPSGTGDLSQLAGLPAQVRDPIVQLIAGGFADTFWVALGLLALCLVPAFLLPRRPVATSADGAGAPPAMMH